ncbi:MAG TPA: DNA polymerase III subunit delta [Selenomonadales bacterium]|nr:DNA polymerase III subunit delta [Selenomonadales bacterium]
MEFSQAFDEIKKGHIRPAYLLHGEETYFARRLEHALMDAVVPPDERAMSLAVCDRDPAVAELVNMIETVPFMGGKNLIIIRGSQLFKPARKASGDAAEKEGDSGDERLLNLLAAMPDYTHLVFSTTDSVDKRRKLYKAMEKNGAVVELAPLKARDVRPWVAARLGELGKKLAPEAMEHFLAAVSLMPQVSLGLLAGELDKAALYSKSPVISRGDLEAVMSSLPEVSVFAMIDAISQKQVGKALKLLQDELAAGENALKLLALLVRQVRMLWQGKELAARGLGARDIAERLGVPPFVGEKLVRQAQGFTAAKLEKAMVALAAADQDLKMGRTDPFALERIIIEMCGK